MKLKTLIILLTISTQVFSQHSFEYFHSNDEVWTHFIETEDNKLAFFMDDSLFLFSQEGEILEKRKNFDGDYSIWSVLKANGGGYYTVGFYDYVQYSHFNFWFKKYDSNFESLWEKTYFVNMKDREWFWTWDCIQNYDNDILVLFATDSIFYNKTIPDTSFIYQFNENADFIRSYKFKDNAGLRNGHLAQIPDTSGYLFSNFNLNILDGGGSIIKLDNDFHIDTIFDTYLDSNIDYRYYHGLKFISDTTFLYGGQCIYQNHGYTDNVSAISHFDTSFNELKSIVLGKNNVYNKTAAYKMFDWTDTSAIYFAYAEPGIHFYPPQELNYSVITKLNSSLEVQWEKFYGDSVTMSMTLKNIHATKDGGVYLPEICNLHLLMNGNQEPLLLN